MGVLPSVPRAPSMQQLVLLTPLLVPCAAVAGAAVQISMLRRSDKTKSFGSAGDLVATVEQQEGVVGGSTGHIPACTTYKQDSFTQASQLRVICASASFESKGYEWSITGLRTAVSDCCNSSKAALSSFHLAPVAESLWHAASALNVCYQQAVPAWTAG